jgi:hydroxymethylglutaryl-CoA lyase
MQGIINFIPTSEKADYLSTLLKVGFDVIDAGSFVSHKSIPQLADTADLFRKTDFSNSKSKILAIVANQRGAEEAMQFEMINYIGYPFSISETFQLRNTNSTILQSFQTVEKMQSLVLKNNKKLRIYISMAFGNPYGDDWNSEIVNKWLNHLLELGITDFALADTTGVSTINSISELFVNIVPEIPNNTILSAHLHAPIDEVQLKVAAAWENGCRHFDTAFKGFGGCPMASDALTGNVATELVYSWSKIKNISTNIDEFAFYEAEQKASALFNKYH